VKPQATTAADYVPETGGLPVLRKAVQECRGCDLYRHASQAVFGEGPRSATVVFIGEQPGDEEDRRGRPFVGPAGRLLDRALEEAGIELGSGTPNKKKVGKVTRAQVKKIAEIKMPDLNCDTLESAMKMVAGAARSMGLEVVD